MKAKIRDRAGLRGLYGNLFDPPTDYFPGPTLVIELESDEAVLLDELVVRGVDLACAQVAGEGLSTQQRSNGQMLSKAVTAAVTELQAKARFD